MNMLTERNVGLRDKRVADSRSEMKVLEFAISIVGNFLSGDIIENVFSINISLCYKLTPSVQIVLSNSFLLSPFVR